MKRKRDGFVPIGDVAAGVELPGGRALTPAAPAAQRHFTRLDQVALLMNARDVDPDIGFQARMMALCSLPRTNPGNRIRYVRRNGPYTLGITAGISNKLPYGSLARLLMAWVSTEAVRMQSPELVLGHSLTEFMNGLCCNFSRRRLVT